MRKETRQAPRRGRWNRAALAWVGMAVMSANASTPPAQPPVNPYLAQSYNNQTHWNSAQWGGTDIAVPRGSFELTPESLQVIPNESGSLPHATDNVAGVEVHWWWAGYSLRKVRVQEGKLVEIARVSVPVTLPDYRAITPEQRREQARATQKFLEARDERGLLDYMKSQPNRMLTAMDDQVANGSIYAVLTREDAFIGASGRRVFRVEQENPKDPASGMKLVREAVLPASLFDNEKAKRASKRIKADALLGMGMTFNGYLVLNTLGGKVITVDRETLHVIDVFGLERDDEYFFNSFATGDEADGGAVYGASNQVMYRFVVDRNGRIHSDEASGAWQAAYDRGVMIERVKIADGTGSTPDLMGFGPNEDRLVVITDGARKMRMVAFWRDQIPQGWKQKPGTLSARIVDQREVDLGPGIDTVQSEQSVGVYGDYAFVVNNIPTGEAPFAAENSYYVTMLNGATRPGPKGAAMFRWDHRQHAWTTLWTRNDVSSISVVPMISGGSRMAIIDGYFADRWNDRHHIGMDLDTGKTVMKIRAGTDPTLNGMFAPIKCDSQGRILYGTAFGFVLLDTSRMRRVD
jgi:hypothetical protein